MPAKIVKTLRCWLIVMQSNEGKYALKNNLKYIRKSLDITQQELADHVGVQKAYYSRLERGEFIPNVKVCLVIQQAILNIFLERTGKHIEKLTIDRLFYLDKL